MTTASILLAAGLGKRMHSDLPKMLHPLLGKALVFHALDSVLGISDLPPTLVLGHGSERVRKAVDEKYSQSVNYAFQAQQLGTGHAVLCAKDSLPGKADTIIVTLADMPLIRPESIRCLMEVHQSHHNVLTMTSLIVDNPRGFGRVIRDPNGKLEAIVEEVDCNAEQRKVNELNASVYCFDAEWLWENLAKLAPSKKGEYYLTDLLAMARGQGRSIDCSILPDPVEGLGVNSRLDLADCERALRQRINRGWLLAGVSMQDPEQSYIEPDVQIGQDTTLLAGTHLSGKTIIGKGCLIGPNTTIKDSTIGNACRIQYSVLEGATLGNQVSMGPYAHLRPGAVLQDHVHMGNFGEVKDSTLGAGTKMGHFSYIGNAQIGQNVNIGAGTVTCNFDGIHKNKTVIGDEVFIGSDTMLVAPLTIGAGAKTAAGAVVTHDVDEKTLVVGVPARPMKRKD